MTPHPCFALYCALQPNYTSLLLGMQAILAKQAEKIGFTAGTPGFKQPGVLFLILLLPACPSSRGGLFHICRFVGLPLKPGQALPFLRKERKQRFAKAPPLESVPGTTSGGFLFQPRVRRSIERRALSCFLRIAGFGVSSVGARFQSALVCSVPVGSAALLLLSALGTVSDSFLFQPRVRRSIERRALS